MTTPPCTLAERLAVALAHTMKDAEVGFTGLATGGPAALYATAIPLAAMELARRTFAPNLTVLLAGWIHNPNLTKLERLPDSEFEVSMRELECEAQMKGHPGPWVLQRGDIDFGFSSGVQVDVEGNLNSVCIGDYERPNVRLVGPILQPEHMTLFGREYVMMPHHERRNFVEKVDFVSGVGYPGGIDGRKRLGLERGGPALVVTPRCIFDFDASGRMRVKFRHPHVEAEELQAATGFDLGDLSSVPTTPDPSSEELEILRREVDPRDILLPRAAA